MSSKHLGPGSHLPPSKRDTLRLYSMVFCPFAQRTRLVLEHKKIPWDTYLNLFLSRNWIYSLNRFEIVNITLKKKPEWYVNINPLQEVPTLEFEDGRKLFESLIIAEYLDNAFENDKIIPKDAYELARHRLIINYFTKIIPYYYKLALKKDLNVGDELNNLLAEFIVHLKDDYFGGNLIIINE